MYHVGIIGQGFVGGAMREALITNPNVSLWTYDSDPRKPSTGSFHELVKQSRIIFICVPTPMGKNGECDTSIVEKIVAEINSLCTGRIILIKSTVPPGTTATLQQMYPNNSILFNPEFLREATAVQDVRNQKYILLGCPQTHWDVINYVDAFFRAVFPGVDVLPSGSRETEMAKYVSNTFLALKVTYANQLKILCDRTDIDYKEVIALAQFDQRLGESHWQVPGPDGQLGYGGSCFPKDVSGLLAWAMGHYGAFPLLQEARMYNNALRALSAPAPESARPDAGVPSGA